MQGKCAHIPSCLAIFIQTQPSATTRTFRCGNNVVSKTENTLGKTQLVQEGQWEGGAREVEKRRAEATYLLCLGSGKDTSAYLQRMQKAKVSPPCSPEH